MSEMDFEKQLHSIAGQMNYPRTPDVAGFVTARLHRFDTVSESRTVSAAPEIKPRFLPRRLAWSLTLIVVLFFSLMLIPPARAAILEFIQIGIVRIFPRPSEPPIEFPGTATPQSFAPMTATSSSSDLIPILSQLAGERTLAEAQKMVDYTILMPAYPAELGAPDRVFVQDAEGAMSILVWLDPQQTDKILMSLHFIPAGSWAISKGMPVNILETSVNGQRAIWGEGPYPLRLYNGDLEFMRLIEGHVLIWAVDDITYRLETDLPLEEAIRTAESLEPIR